MSNTKSLYINFSGFVGKLIKISELFSDVGWSSVIEGEVLGINIAEYRNENFRRTMVTFVLGNITKNSAHYATTQNLLKDYPKAIVPFQISWENNKLAEKFKEIRIDLV